MPTPAIRQIVEHLESILTPALSGVSVFIDRHTDEPLTEDELPAVLIRPVEAEVGGTEHGSNSFEHKWSLDMDIFSGTSALSSIDARQADIVSAIMSAIGADPYLDGMAHLFEPRSWTASEDAVPDAGCSVLTWELWFFTPSFDWNSIIRVDGQIL